MCETDFDQAEDFGKQQGRQLVNTSFLKKKKRIGKRIAWVAKELQKTIKNERERSKFFKCPV